MKETAQVPADPPAKQDFESRVRKHQAGLRAFVRALGVAEAWVDDLAQEVFIVAHRRLNQFEPHESAGGEAPIADLLPAMKDCVEELPPRSRDLLQRRLRDSPISALFLVTKRPCGQRD